MKPYLLQHTLLEDEAESIRTLVAATVTALKIFMESLNETKRKIGILYSTNAYNPFKLSVNPLYQLHKIRITIHIMMQYLKCDSKGLSVVQSFRQICYSKNKVSGFRSIKKILYCNLYLNIETLTTSSEN